MYRWTRGTALFPINARSFLGGFGSFSNDYPAVDSGVPWICPVTTDKIASFEVGRRGEVMGSRSNQGGAGEIEGTEIAATVSDSNGVKVHKVCLPEAGIPLHPWRDFEPSVGRPCLWNSGLAPRQPETAVADVSRTRSG